MTAAISISVIIPHLNQPDFLNRCLASLAAQDAAPEFEIIVVDNGSSVLPETVVADHPRARLVSEPEPGPGPARNRGVAEATAPILAFIDADCLAEPGWLARIEDWFAAHPDDGILGGDVYIARTNQDRATPLEAYESIYAYRMKEYIARQGFTGTGNLAIRRTVWDAVGIFGGIHIAEDRDWGQRAGKLGFHTTYVPGMIVYHPARENFAELAQKWDRHTAHDFTRTMSRKGGRLRWLARTVAVAGSPVGEFLRIARSDRVTGVRERLLAFVVLIRIRFYRAWIMLKIGLAGRADHLSGAWNRE